MNQETKNKLLSLLKHYYGFDRLRPGQEQAIDNVLSGVSSLVVMPTGGGKSLCYQLPALMLDGLTIVISPLIALMKDQVDSLNRLGVPATFINSSISPAEATARLRAAHDGLFKLLYIAPERFYNHDFIEGLRDLPVSLFAVDEAHCISQWGHDFRPSYRQMNRALNIVGHPTIIALTATATPEVRTDIIKQLNLDNTRQIITGFARPNLQFGAAVMSEGAKTEFIINQLLTLPEPTGIIYAGTRGRTEDLVNYLAEAGINATAYHAGLEASERERIQDNFMSDKTPIIIATNAFGMGIDKSNIRFVIHDGLPPNIESYYQEAGRAGRDGKASLCFLLISSRDRYLREFFIKGDNPPVETVLDVYDVLIADGDNRQMFTYAQLKAQLGESVPDMAIGTALKILESGGYISRSRETQGQASLQLLTDSNKAASAISSGAKKQLALLAGLENKYFDQLTKGWQVNIEEIATGLNAKKATLNTLLKTLSEAGHLDYKPPFKGSEVLILKRVPRDEVVLDRQSLSDKYTAACQKLDIMENYAYHQGCRQQYILNYFGENNAPHCGNCDWCVQKGAKHLISNTTDYSKEKLKKSKQTASLTTKLTQLETFELLQKGLTPKDIAKQRDISVNTVYEHLAYLAGKKLPIGLDKLIDKKNQELIIKMAKQVGFEILKPLKESLPETISYNQIKLVLADAKVKKLL